MHVDIIQPNSGRKEFFELNKLLSDANNCFVCGPNNPIGLRLKFHLKGDVCVANFKPGRNLCGYNGIVHGGIIFSVLDDVMGNWLFLNGKKAFTARCSIRYFAELPCDSETRLEGHVLKQRGRMTQMRGVIRSADDDQIFAETEGFFMESSQISAK